MRILVANRGEVPTSRAFLRRRLPDLLHPGQIAIRIRRAVEDLGMEAVLVYSQDDSNSLHVRTRAQVPGVLAALAAFGGSQAAFGRSRERRA